MDEKEYVSDNKRFTLKVDLDLEESEIVSDFFKDSYAKGKTEINLGNFSSSQVAKFFATVLEPVDGRLPAEFNFKKIKESVQLEVFKDFFLSRVQRAQDSLNSLGN